MGLSSPAVVLEGGVPPSERCTLVPIGSSGPEKATNRMLQPGNWQFWLLFLLDLGKQKTQDLLVSVLDITMVETCVQD